MKHDIRILKESFNNFLTEIEKEDPASGGLSGGLVDINAGPEAVLAAAKKIPQNVLQAGATDGLPDDEKITITAKTLAAESFIPSQQNIDCDKSLADQIYDLNKNLDAAIAGGNMNSKQGSFPILTFGGKHIIDGHHRWSQALLTNPKCMLNTADIAAPGVTDVKQAIALTHVILFALYKQSPVKNTPGTNLVGMTPETMREMVMTGKGLQANKPIVQSAIDKLFAAGLIPEKTAEAAADMYAKNVSLVTQGDFPRHVMPQPLDADPTNSGLTDPKNAKLAGLGTGNINYIDPKQADVKESYYKTITKMLNEAVKH